MAFNSFHFWIVFPFIFSFYWLIPNGKQTIKKIFLLVVGYLFYMNWNPLYVFVLLGITFVSYSGGYYSSQIDARQFSFYYCWQ